MVIANTAAFREAEADVKPNVAGACAGSQRSSNGNTANVSWSCLFELVEFLA